MSLDIIELRAALVKAHRWCLQDVTEAQVHDKVDEDYSE